MIDNIKKVLLIDDDQNIRLVVQMTLEGLTEWKIVTAESGKADFRYSTKRNA